MGTVPFTGGPRIYAGRLSLRARYGLVACAVILASALGSAGAAQGAVFMSQQGLSAGNAYAGPAHSYIQHVEVGADHSQCAGVANGYSGYTSSPFSGGHNTYYSYCAPYSHWCWQANCGAPGVPSGQRPSSYNGNVSTYDYIYGGGYWWGA